MVQSIEMCKACKCYGCDKGPANKNQCNYCGSCTGGFTYCPKKVDEENHHFGKFVESAVK